MRRHPLLASDHAGREHHALLGVEVVHFSARDSAHAEHVAAMNRRSGRSDTFTHLPALDPTSPFGFHDECAAPCDRPDAHRHVTVNDCFARARAATEFLGVMDIDEYMALDASATWSASSMLRELRGLPANVTSAQLEVRRSPAASLTHQWSWLDPNKHGHVSSQALEKALPGLAEHEAVAITELKQTAARQHINACKMCYYYKVDWLDAMPLTRGQTIHRTASVLSGSIHTAARTVDMGPVDGLTIGEFDLRVRNFATTPNNVRIHHVRTTSPMLDHETFEPLPLGPGIVGHWLRVARSLAAE